MNLKGLTLLSVSILGAVIACSDNHDNKGSVDQKMECVNGELKTVGIFGGKTLSTDSYAGQGIVLLIRGDVTSGEVYICTGSLIDKNIVLTAAHCVPSNEDETQMSVAFSGDPVCQVHNDGKSALKKVSRVMRNPLYETKPGSTNDLAMVRLEQVAPMHYHSLKLIDHAVALNSNSSVYVSGFGVSTDYNAEDSARPLLRVAAISPLASSDDDTKVTRSNEQPILFFDQRNGQGACAGDSGGPTFLKEQGQLYVMGVNSAVDSLKKEDFKEKTEVTCHVGLRSVSVYAQRDWIARTYNQLLNSDSVGDQFRQ